MYFEIISEIESIETIATGGKIRDIMRLRKQYGFAKWRKLKGIAKVRLQRGRMCNAGTAVWPVVAVSATAKHQIALSVQQLKRIRFMENAYTLKQHHRISLLLRLKLF